MEVKVPTSEETTNTKEVDKPKALEEIKKNLAGFRTGYEPSDILKEADAKVSRSQEEGEDGEDEDEEDENPNTFDNPIIKAMTLSEFQNGVLLTVSVEDPYRTFGIDMLRKLIEENNCVTISEQATAELATINYIRTLTIQRRITAYLDMNSLTDNGVKYLAILSKELDRANRHYLTAIQILKTMKQPLLNVNVKANTAIVGQNQAIQEN